jgi:hypothetical protein
MLSDGRQPISQVLIRLPRNQVPQINLEWERDDMLVLGQLSQFIRIQSTSVQNQDGSYHVKNDLFCSSPPNFIFIFGNQFLFYVLLLHRKA